MYCSPGSPGSARIRTERDPKFVRRRICNLWLLIGSQCHRVRCRWSNLTMLSSLEWKVDFVVDLSVKIFCMCLLAFEQVYGSTSPLEEISACLYEMAIFNSLLQTPRSQVSVWVASTSAPHSLLANALLSPAKQVLTRSRLPGSQVTLHSDQGPYVPQAEDKRYFAEQVPQERGCFFF